MESVLPVYAIMAKPLLSQFLQQVTTNGIGRSTEGAVIISNYASREEREANSTGNTENCFPGRGKNIHNTWLPHTDLSSFSPWKVFT